MRALAILLLFGCGESGGGTETFDAAPFDGSIADATTPDAPPPDGPQFDGRPSGLVVSNGNGGTMPADYSCNGSRVDPPGATAEFTVDGTVVDYQAQNPVPGATIASSIDAMTVYDSKLTDGTGHFSGLRIPANHYRVSFRTTAPGQIQTLEIAVPVPPVTTSMQRNSVSSFTANAMPGLVGINYDMTRALVVARVLDCQGRTVGGAVCMISSTPDSQVFYFSDQGLPVRKTLQMVTNFNNGLIAGINAPPATNGSIQVTDPTPGAGGPPLGQVAFPLIAGGFTLVDVPPTGP